MQQSQQEAIQVPSVVSILGGNVVAYFIMRVHGNGRIATKAHEIEHREGYGFTMSSVMTSNGNLRVIADYILKSHAQAPQMARECQCESISYSVAVLRESDCSSRGFAFDSVALDSLKTEDLMQILMQASQTRKDRIIAAIEEKIQWPNEEVQVVPDPIMHGDMKVQFEPATEGASQSLLITLPNGGVIQVWSKGERSVGACVEAWDSNDDRLEGMLSREMHL